MADSDGQVVIDLSLRKDGIQSDIQWLTEELKNVGVNVNTDQISNKFENAMNKAKSAVNEAVDSINSKKADPKISADDSDLKEKTKESTEKLDSLNHKQTRTKISADDTDLVEKTEKSDKELKKIPKEKSTTLKVNDEASRPVKEVASSVNEASEKTHTLRDVMMGTFVGGLVQSGISAITNGFHEMTKAGEEYNVQQDTMRINWENLTREAPQDGQAMIKMINDFSQQSIYSSECLDKMAQSFYHVHSNAQETKQWTQDFVNLGSTLHVSNDALAEAAEQFAKIEAGGKANAMDMQMMINRFPMFGEALQKATGKSMQQLYQLSEKGKLTADVFSKALDYLGNKYKSSQAEAMTSFQGMSMHLKSQFSRLSGDIMKSSFNMSKSTLAAIQKITDDKSMQQYANMISQAFANMMSGVSKAILYVSEHKDDIMSVIKSIASITGTIGGAIWDTFKDVISGIADAFNTLSGNASKSNNPLKNISSALKEIASHKQALRDIGTIIASIFVTKKISGFILGMTSFVSKVKEATGIADGLKATIAALGGPVGIAIAAIAGLTVAFIGLYKNNAKFREFVNGIIKDLQNFAKSFVAGFKNAFDNIGKFFKGDLGWQKDLEENLNKIGSTIGKAVKPWVKPIQDCFSGIGKIIESDVTVWERNINKFVKSVTEFFSSLGKNISSIWKTITSDVDKGIKNVQKVISPVLNAISKEWNKVWKALSNTVSNIMKNIYKFVSQHMTQIRNIISSVLKIVSTIWSTAWKQVENIFKLAWDTIFHQSRVVNDIRRIITTAVNATKVIWKNAWNAVKNYFAIVWDEIKGIARTGIYWIKSIITGTLRIIQIIWNKIWSAIKDFVDNIWDGIKKIVSNAINSVHDIISNVLNRISDVWHSMWTSFSNFFKGIWKDIKQAAADGINGVLRVINAGIDGIDAVWKFFTGKETSIHHLSPVHFSQGGIVDRHLSMVNDGGGADWKELIETPDGDLMMSDKRNAILPLEPGTRVYNGAETRQIMTMLGVDHYANGGIVGGVKHYKDGGVVGDLIDWGAHELKDFGSWIKDKWDAITKFLKHPLENTKAIISKAISGPLSKLSSSNMVALGKGVFDKLTKPISDWFKKGLEEAKKKHDEESVGGFGNIKDMKNSAELRDLVKAALEANGLSTDDSMIARVMRQIATESGGNAHAVQPGADPDGDGSGPALGLMQTKRSTFNAYKAPGHDDIFNAYDNLLAALNYAKHRYGPSLSFLGNGHGYDNGGVINKKELAWLAENNREFVINPQRDSADELLKEAAAERAAYDPNSAIAQAIAGINSARDNNGVIVPNAVAGSSITHTSTVSPKAGNNNGVGSIIVDLDGKTIAQASYQYTKVLQGQDVRLQTRKGGAVFG